MDDEKFNELYDVLVQYKDAIDFLKGETDELREMYKTQSDRVAELETILFEKIIKPTMAAENEKAYEEFHAKYGEKLDPYNEKLRAVEGNDDVDLSREAFNGFKEYVAPEGTTPYSEEEYVDALISQVDEQIENIKAKLGLSEETPVEIKQDEDGNTEVVADGEVVASEETEKEAVEKTPAESDEADETKEEQPSLFDEVEESDSLSEEEMKELKDELDELKKSMPNY